MSAKPFLDTNIVIYAFGSGDPRCVKAEQLLAAGGTISVQVLNEFVNVSRRKMDRNWQEIAAALGVIRTLLGQPAAITVRTHEAALALARRRSLAFYDALIVASAIESDCDTVLSEDMQHGAKMDGVTIRNPFRAD
jgi:predicted nucleic acid-binding protein